MIIKLTKQIWDDTCEAYYLFIRLPVFALAWMLTIVILPTFLVVAGPVVLAEMLTKRYADHPFWGYDVLKVLDLLKKKESHDDD